MATSPRKLHARSRTLKFDQIVGARLRAFRGERGLSQTMFAVKLDISAQQLQKYETGVNRLSFGRAVEVAEILGVSLIELGGLKGSVELKSNPPLVVRSRNGQRTNNR